MKYFCPQAEGNRMSIDDLVEAGKTSIREATMVITTEGRDVSTQWINTRGEQIALCLGCPALCTNSPAREKCRCVHFSVYWMKVLGEGSYCHDHAEYNADDILESWLNQQLITASECVSVGGIHITRGIWHARKNRWMWGPKQSRR